MYFFSISKVMTVFISICASIWVGGFKEDCLLTGFDGHFLCLSLAKICDTVPLSYRKIFGTIAVHYSLPNKGIHDLINKDNEILFRFCFLPFLQLAKFRKLKSHYGRHPDLMCDNYRPLQKLKGRKVYSVGNNNNNNNNNNGGNNNNGNNNNKPGK